MNLDIEKSHRSSSSAASSYRSKPPIGSLKSKDWIKRLVRNEAELIRTGSGDLLSHQDHRKVVEESTSEYLNKLKGEFLSCVDLFNSYRGGAHLPNSVKIFNVSNTVSDFIIFRNNLKLVVSNPALGIVNFSFVSRSHGFKPDQIKSKKEGYDLFF